MSRPERNRPERNRKDMVVRVHPQELRIKKRQTDDGQEESVLEGYAVKWNDMYTIDGWWSEKIVKGAFEESLKERDVIVLNGHMRELVLGSTRSGTNVYEDDTGLRFESPLNGTTWASDVRIGVENKDIDGVSVGMRITGESYEDGAGENGLRLYTVNTAELYEFSMTSFPAYEQTEVEARSDRELNERRQRAVAETENADEARETRLRIAGEDADRERRLRASRAALEMAGAAG